MTSMMMLARKKRISPAFYHKKTWSRCLISSSTTGWIISINTLQGLLKKNSLPYPTYFSHNYDIKTVSYIFFPPLLANSAAFSRWSHGCRAPRLFQVGDLLRLRFGLKTATGQLHGVAAAATKGTAEGIGWYSEVFIILDIVLKICCL